MYILSCYCRFCLHWIPKHGFWWNNGLSVLLRCVWSEVYLKMLIKGLGFVLWYLEKGNLKRTPKNFKKLPVFCHKLKTLTLTQNLRHTSLDKNISLCIYKSLYLQVKYQARYRKLTRDALLRYSIQVLVLIL